MRITVELSQEARKAIAKWRDRERQLKPRLAQAARRGAELLAGEIAAKELGEGGSLKVVTGMLRRSMRGRLVSSGDIIVAGVGVIDGPAAKYARVHERGGVIRAKGGALAIPLDAAKTPGGKPKYPGGPREAQQKFPKMFMLKQEGQPPLLCITKRVRGKAGGKVSEIVPLFVLLKSVRMPARRWLSTGAARHRGVFVVEVQEELTALLAE